jgi:hypothetical protein
MQGIWALLAYMLADSAGLCTKYLGIWAKNHKIAVWFF